MGCNVPTQTRITALNATCLLLFLLACSGTQDSPPGEIRETARDQTITVGKTVKEIDPRIWKIHQDRKGDYWFGSNGSGIYRYDGKKVTQFTKADGLCGDQVRGIVEGADGRLFISTNGGVALFDGKSLTALEIVDMASDTEGWELNEEDVWIANLGNSGALRFDGKKLHHLILPGLPAEQVLSERRPNSDFLFFAVYRIFKDSRGHIWIGTSGSGLCRYDGKSVSWMHEPALTTTPSGGSFGIRSIYEDKSGDFWICNTRQRFRMSPEIRVENGRKLIRFETKAGLPNAQLNEDKNFTYYHDIAEDKAGALWFASGSDGIMKYDGTSVVKYPLPEGVYALQIFLDQKGKLWLGTLEHGIFNFNGERFAPFKPHG
ncbi:MAG: ligand-binding sensor domain-containing protein [Planctomycetota bacterium]|jgi:ligand-binding sensor domain-containing protein